MNDLYRIASWHETFERAESRKLKQLQWIALPIAFSGTGYQQLLEDFEDDAPAIYGAWCALCAFAATCRIRGVLCNSRGNPLKLSHVARIIGFPEPIFQRLIDWAVAPNIGWLESVPPSQIESMLAAKSDARDQKDVAVEPPDDPPTITQSAGGIPQAQDSTEPYRTGQDKTIDRSDLDRKWRTMDKDFLDEVLEMANRFQRLRVRLDRDLIWRACWVSVYFDPGTLLSCLERLQVPRAIAKPQSYVASAMVKLCQRNGADWDELKHIVPSTPPPPSQTRSIAADALEIVDVAGAKRFSATTCTKRNNHSPRTLR